MREVVASTTALLVPRDIVIVADISGSTSFDSQLRHYDIPEIEVNLFDVWAGLPLAKGNAGGRACLHEDSYSGTSRYLDSSVYP